MVPQPGLAKPLDAVSLRIMRKGERYLFEYKPGPEYSPWRTLEIGLDPERFVLDQELVALVAFQGVTDADGRPRDATPQEAGFDYLEIEILDAAAHSPLAASAQPKNR